MENKKGQKKGLGPIKKENVATAVGAAVVGGAATAVTGKLFGGEMTDMGTKGTILEEELLPQDDNQVNVNVNLSPKANVSHENSKKSEKVDLDTFLSSVLQKANTLNTVIQNL